VILEREKLGIRAGEGGEKAGLEDKSYLSVGVIVKDLSSEVE
jgi:hypothetical protein